MSCCVRRFLSLGSRVNRQYLDVVLVKVHANFKIQCTDSIGNGEEVLYSLLACLNYYFVGTHHMVISITFNKPSRYEGGKEVCV